MTRQQLIEAIETGKLYTGDVTGKSAYVYYEPGRHEHASHYVKRDGVWVWENGIYGDLTEAVGGDKAESLMLELLGLTDEK